MKNTFLLLCLIVLSLFSPSVADPVTDGHDELATLLSEFENKNTSLEKRREIIYGISNNPKLRTKIPLRIIQKALNDSNISIRLHGLTILKYSEDLNLIVYLLRSCLTNFDDQIRLNALRVVADIDWSGCLIGGRTELSKTVADLLSNSKLAVSAIEALRSLKIIDDPDIVARLSRACSTQRCTYPIGDIELTQDTINYQFMTSYNSIENFELAAAIQRGFLHNCHHNTPILKTISASLESTNTDRKEQAIRVFLYKPLPLAAAKKLVRYLSDSDTARQIVRYLSYLNEDPSGEIAQTILKCKADWSYIERALTHLVNFNDQALLGLANNFNKLSTEGKKSLLAKR